MTNDDVVYAYRLRVLAAALGVGLGVHASGSRPTAASRGRSVC